ncbi:hypothetical protein PMIN04_010085 [Paraphaeosphaeria minitans]
MGPRTREGSMGEKREGAFRSGEGGSAPKQLGPTTVTHQRAPSLSANSTEHAHAEQHVKREAVPSFTGPNQTDALTPSRPHALVPRPTSASQSLRLSSHRRHPASTAD